MRVLIDKPHLIQFETPARPRFIVNPHAALNFPKRSEHRLDRFRRGSVEQQEKAFLIALFGRKKKVPLLSGRSHL
jgi:hypothetical protein